MDLSNTHTNSTQAYITKHTQTFTHKKDTHTQYMNMSRYNKYKNKGSGKDTHSERI